MTHHTKIICDGCEKKICPTEGFDSWYLQLSKIKNTTYNLGVAYDVLVRPPIDKDMQFHDLNCIKKFLEQK